MEAAKKSITTAGNLGLKRSIAGLFAAKGAHLLSLQTGTDGLAQARDVALPETAVPAELTATSAPAELVAAVEAKLVAGEAATPEALGLIRQIQAAVSDGSKTMAEAAGLYLVANALGAAGEGKDAYQAASRALAIVRELKNAKAQAAVLQSVISISFSRKDPDEALRAATELAKVAIADKNRILEGMAMVTCANAHLANNDARAAAKAADEALAALKGAGDKAGQAAALSVLYNVSLLGGKPVAASKAAQEVAAVVKGDKKAEAAAGIMLGSAFPASKDALEAAKGAVTALKGLGDKAGAATALITQACAHLAQEKQADEAVQAAREALALMKEAGSKGGEAVALSVLAAAHVAKEDSEEAQKAARESLNIFRDLADAVGEAHATALLKDAKTAGIAPVPTRVVFDKEGVAHVEVGDACLPEAFEESVGALQAREGLKCIVLHVEGAPREVTDSSYAVGVGKFLMGLRTIGLPVICACWGRIAGPTWGFVLASDYRIAATSTSFMVPIWGPPEILGDLVGHNTATHLNMQTGPKDSLTMLEHNILHQAQKGKDDTRKVAGEMAKRVATTPGMYVRQNMQLMTPYVEELAVKAAKGMIAV
mmetsp:Transcript_80548/g.211495  ORF Transcript_80548/g.211495 Transcript_80548/m.211495 type:complete len:600 (-) Transcript_80548:44-1843(-)